MKIRSKLPLAILLPIVYLTVEGIRTLIGL